MKFLANSDTRVINALLKELGLKARVRRMEDVEFRTQVHTGGPEGPSVPDARLASDKAGFVLLFEAKVGEGFGPPQAKRHLGALLSMPANKERALVLVTSAGAWTEQFACFEAESRTRRGPVKVISFTWHQLDRFLGTLTRLPATSRFLVDHYRSHLHEEVLMELRDGFGTDYARKWAARGEAWAVTDTFAKHIGCEVDRLLYDRSSQKAKGSHRTAHELSGVYRTWSLYQKGAESVTLYAGVWAEDGKPPAVFVSCWWDGLQPDWSSPRERTARRRLGKGGTLPRFLVGSVSRQCHRSRAGAR